MVSAAPSKAAERTHLRGERYCEILLKKTLTTYAVYNTVGLNDCPEASWKKETVALVKQETGASAVHLNGPRYWVIDGFLRSNLVNPTVKTIGGLAMREAGVLRLKVMDLLRAPFPYKEHKVNRQTTWVYEAKKPVYELINPEGQVFVMQSYSIEKYPQTLSSLSQLGTVLNLPSGWKFKTGMIEKEETLSAMNKVAVVIQDDHLNTYQLATHDFLPGH